MSADAIYMQYTCIEHEVSKIAGREGAENTILGSRFIEAPNLTSISIRFVGDQQLTSSDPVLIQSAWLSSSALSYLAILAGAHYIATS